MTKESCYCEYYCALSDWDLVSFVIHYPCIVIPAWINVWADLSHIEERLRSRAIYCEKHIHMVLTWWNFLYAIIHVKHVNFTLNPWPIFCVCVYICRWMAKEPWWYIPVWSMFCSVYNLVSFVIHYHCWFKAWYMYVNVRAHVHVWFDLCLSYTCIYRGKLRDCANWRHVLQCMWL